MKKNIKKFAAIALAVMTLSSALSISASAAGTTTVTADRTTTINTTVKANVSASGTVDANNSAADMCVTVAWDNVDFVYNSITEWDPDKLEYKETTGSWIQDTANITVTNKSNIVVDVSTSFEKTTTNPVFENVDASFDKTSARIESAVDKSEAPFEIFRLQLSGTPNAEETTNITTFGTITVNIAGYNETSNSSTGGSLDGSDNDT